ncbi:hypothetical protein V6N12_069387 [Hibiscus sabdariffa]|uniref:Uncharacterized protein n=1 Tax=Hibiscus sabdariffa TaxID=183260 RepID=A0ABR2FDV4_9ROSI
MRESDDLVDSTKTPLELLQDKTPISDGFDDLMRDLLEATIKCVDEQCIVDESSMITAEEYVDVDDSTRDLLELLHNKAPNFEGFGDLIKGLGKTLHLEENFMTMGDDFQAKPTVVLDQIGDGTDEILCDMKICHQFSTVDEGHQMGQFKQLQSTIKYGIDVELIEMNQWDNWISPIDSRNHNISTLSHGQKDTSDPVVGDLMAEILYAIHGSQQNCKAWYCVSSMQPLSTANPLLTLVELDHSYSGRVIGCTSQILQSQQGTRSCRMQVSLLFMKFED